MVGFRQKHMPVTLGDTSAKFSVRHGSSANVASICCGDRELREEGLRWLKEAREEAEADRNYHGTKIKRRLSSE